MQLTIRENTWSIVETILNWSPEVAVFPECALTGYNHVMGGDISRANLDFAYSEIRKACRDSQTSAIVGGPWFDSEYQGKPWNAAVIIDHHGEIVTVQPKIVFTEDEIRNDIFLPGEPDSRKPFRLEEQTCAVLICAEFAGVVGGFSSANCYRILDGLGTKLDTIFVIGVMDMSLDSKGASLASEVATHYDANVVIVNVAEWGFGTPTGNLGGSKVVNRRGEVIALAPFDQVSYTEVELS